jgi:mono/diheme cytochrome c family protein
MIDGKQLVLLPVGSGTTSGLGTYKRLASQAGGPARLLAFALNGTSMLPATRAAHEVFSRPPLPRPNPQLAERGRKVYAQNDCLMCHGMEAVGGAGSVPDLRQVAAMPRQALAAIIIGGALADQGMPKFDKTVSLDDVSALQAFLLKQAWAAYDMQQRKLVRSK